ncbi:MAG: flagellar hook-associated protein FlgL [Granulosicoccus sp.]
MSNSRIPSNLLISRMAADIVRKQSTLSDVQEQISSGKRVNRPSDAPAHSAQIVSMQQTTDRLDQYQRNANSAEAQLSLEETALVGATNTLQRIRELALTSASGIVDDQKLHAISEEIKLRRDELINLANSRDSFGNYLFGGSSNQTKPFSDGNPIQYSGSDDSHNVTIGAGRSINTGDSGSAVFQRIRNGNGTFNVEPNAANTGTGIIEYGSVTNMALYDTQRYEIRFTSSSSYDIVNVSTGSNVQTGVAYPDQANIEFAGIKTSLSGNPQTGDSFLIEPSRNKDIFSIVSDFLTALDSAPQTAEQKSSLQQDVKAVITNIDQGLDHINRFRANVGARLNNIESSREENAGMKLQIERIRSEIEDIDIAEAVTSLQTKATALEILQKSFVRVEGLSLFNHM